MLLTCQPCRPNMRWTKCIHVHYNNYYFWKCWIAFLCAWPLHLTNCGLETPCCMIDLGQQCSGNGMLPDGITCSNADLSLMRSYSILLWAVLSPWVLISKMGLKITLLHTMMTSSNGNIFRVTGHLCREFTGRRWIPRTKASDAELWYFLWSASN